MSAQLIRLTATPFRSKVDVTKHFYVGARPGHNAEAVMHPFDELAMLSSIPTLAPSVARLLLPVDKEGSHFLPFSLVP